MVNERNDKNNDKNNDNDDNYDDNYDGDGDNLPIKRINTLLDEQLG